MRGIVCTRRDEEKSDCAAEREDAGWFGVVACRASGRIVYRRAVQHPLRVPSSICHGGGRHQGRFLLKHAHSIGGQGMAHERGVDVEESSHSRGLVNGPVRMVIRA